MKDPHKPSRSALIDAIRANEASEVHFLTGTLIASPGEEPASALLLLEGSVRLFLPTVEGVIECGVATAGDLVGLAAALARKPAELGMQAVGDVRALQLSPEQLRKILDTNAMLYADAAVLLSRATRSAYRNLRRIRSATARRSPGMALARALPV